MADGRDVPRVGMTTIDAARALTPGGGLGPGRLTVIDGRIPAVTPLKRSASNRWLAPGFVDLQVNGIDDTDMQTADGAQWERLDELLLRQGVTGWCPTLMTMPLDEYARPLARIREAMLRPDKCWPIIVGGHLEGPDLSATAGRRRAESEMMLAASVDFRFASESVPAIHQQHSRTGQG